MPVNTSSSTKQFAGDGTQTTFPFTFPISGEGDLVVKERVDATGVTTTKTLTTHYTVVKSGANFDNGGNVEMGTASAIGVTLLIKRATTQTQGTDLLYGGKHDSEAYEDMVDKNTRMIQELQAQVDRCIKMPDTDSDELDMTLPNSVGRASKWLGFGPASEPTGVQTTPSSVTVSPAAETVLDDATVEAMLATLAAGSGLLGGVGIHIGNDTRAAAGAQAITGVGFQPSVVIFLAVDTTSSNEHWSIGFSDGTTHNAIIAHSGTDVVRSVGNCLSIMRGAGNLITGVISALGADGFTITWSLTGACGINYTYLCLP